MSEEKEWHRKHKLEEKELIKRRVQEFHDKYHPKYIFLTESSAIPFGYLFKEAWKKAYPNEEAPKFYRIDPKYVEDLVGRERVEPMDESEVWSALFHRNGFKRPTPEEIRIAKVKFEEERKEGTQERTQEIVEYLNKRIKDKKAPILIYDEDSASGTSLTSVRNFFKRSGLYDETEEEKETFSNSFRRELRPKIAKIGNVTYYGDDIGFLRNEEDHNERYPVIHITTKKTGSYYEPDIKGSARIVGGTLKNPKRRRRALKDIKYLEQHGREAGQELHAELQRQQTLEQRATGTTAVIGLIGGLFFLSTNITGNAIGNITNSTSNFMGAGLLIIGLIAGFFWMKKR